MNTPKTAKELFMTVFNGQMNFFTPHALEYGWLNDELAYELSYDGRDFYGLTVLSADGERRVEYNHSGGEEEVMSHMERLRKELSK